MYNSVNAIAKGIRAEFAKQLISTPNYVASFCENIQSQNKSEDYLWCDALPQIREWLDAIDFGDVKDYKQTITNKDYEYGIKVDRNILDDSREYLGGNVELQIRGSVKRWSSFPNRLIQDLLEANSTAFDGTAFFSTTRPYLQGSNAINNLYTGTSTATSAMSDDLSGAKTLLLGLRDRNDEPFNEEAKFVVLAPVHLIDKFETLRTLRDVSFSSVGQSNIHVGTFQLVINYRQASTDNDWYLINPNSIVKPFILQTRKVPTWDVKDDNEFPYIKYWATARMAAGLANPMSIVKVNN